MIQYGNCSNHAMITLWCLSHPASAYVIPLPPLLYCSPLSTRALDPCLWHGAHCAWLFLWQVTAFWGQAPWTPWYTYLIPVSVHMFHPNPQVYFWFCSLYVCINYCYIYIYYTFSSQSEAFLRMVNWILISVCAKFTACWSVQPPTPASIWLIIWLLLQHGS